MDSLAFVGMLGARSEQSPPRAKGLARKRVGTECLARPGPPDVIKAALRMGAQTYPVRWAPRAHAEMVIIVGTGSIETAAVRRPRQERLAGVRIDG